MKSIYKKLSYMCALMLCVNTCVLTTNAADSSDIKDKVYGDSNIAATSPNQYGSAGIEISENPTYTFYSSRYGLKILIWESEDSKGKRYFYDCGWIIRYPKASCLKKRPKPYTITEESDNKTNVDISTPGYEYTGMYIGMPIGEIENECEEYLKKCGVTNPAAVSALSPHNYELVSLDIPELSIRGALDKRMKDEQNKDVDATYPITVWVPAEKAKEFEGAYRTGAFDLVKRTTIAFRPKQTITVRYDAATKKRFQNELKRLSGGSAWVTKNDLENAVENSLSAECVNYYIDPEVSDGAQKMVMEQFNKMFETSKKEEFRIKTVEDMIQFGKAFVRDQNMDVEPIVELWKRVEHDYFNKTNNISGNLQLEVEKALKKIPVKVNGGVDWAKQFNSGCTVDLTGNEVVITARGIDLISVADIDAIFSKTITLSASEYKNGKDMRTRVSNCMMMRDHGAPVAVIPHLLEGENSLIWGTFKEHPLSSTEGLQKTTRTYDFSSLSIPEADKAHYKIDTNTVSLRVWADGEPQRYGARIVNMTEKNITVEMEVFPRNPTKGHRKNIIGGRRIYHYPATVHAEVSCNLYQNQKIRKGQEQFEHGEYVLDIVSSTPGRKAELKSLEIVFADGDREPYTAKFLKRRSSTDLGVINITLEDSTVTLKDKRPDVVKEGIDDSGPFSYYHDDGTDEIRIDDQSGDFPEEQY